MSDISCSVSNSPSSNQKEIIPQQNCISQVIKNDSPNKSNNAKCSNSESDLRAASMRAKIELKLSEIETEMKQQQEALVGHDFFEANSSEVFGMDENIHIQDKKRTRSYSLAEMKESAITHLKEQLDDAQKELKLKDIEVSKLSRVRDEVGLELEDLTASLFEEANKMVYDANVKRSNAEKHAKEANMKLNVLQEEVIALKTLIQTTISSAANSSPSPHSSLVHDAKKLSRKSSTSSDGDSHSIHSLTDSDPFTKKEDPFETDPVLHREFVSWRQNPVIERDHPFLKRIYSEDIDPCMNFENKELSTKVLQAIEEGNLIIESISGKTPLPKLCALLQTPRFCHYRMNLGFDEDFYISRLSRNRIAAICDLFCYLKYVVKGLITQSVHEVFHEVLKRRKAICVARLGLLD